MAEKAKDGSHTITATIPAAMKDELEKAAEMQDRAMSVVVKRAIDHYLHCGRGAGCQHDYDLRMGSLDEDAVPVAGPAATEYLESGAE